MARIYVHLTRGERERIRVLRLAKLSIRAIARALSRAPSTILREISRHKHHNGYEPERADGHARVVRKRARRSRKMMLPELAVFVKDGLLKGWSPEQIAGRLRAEFPPHHVMIISYQGIYNWLAQDKKTGGKWYKCLRLGTRRCHNRTKGIRRSDIANRKNISTRPRTVESRRYFGDWEADTVRGKLNSGHIATLVDRKSRYTVIAKLEKNRAQCFNEAIITRFKNDDWLPIRTITADNGPEFARHNELSEQLGAPVYFADPYCSWQRGTNENTNGLIRQYLPKGLDFRTVTAERVALVENLLNNRPRKTLNYRTPYEVMAKKFRPAAVALVT